MKNRNPKMRTPLTSIALLHIFLCSLFVFQVSPTKADVPHAEVVWVLTETLVNPLDGQKEFYGGGATPGWYGEARFEGTFVKYGVTETSFRIDDRFVDHEYEHHNVTIETFFEKPPLKMTPGETVELIAGFAHSGTVQDGGIRVQFWYDSEDVNIQPATVFAYAPWADNFDGTTEATYSFKVPPASSGGEIEIYATWWNAEPCLVIWKYQAQEAQPTVTDLPMDERRGWSKSEDECARMRQKVADDAQYSRGGPVDELKKGYIGLVVGVMGDVVQEYCDGEERPLPRGGWISSGDCIRTGPNGRSRIQMNDRDDLRNVGPTAINIASNSVLCFGKFDVRFDLNRQESAMDLITGAIRVFFKGWGRNDSVSVRTGVTVCGIRGSDVFISYFPSDDLVYTMVLEGHMDVTSETIGETVSLTDNQSLVVTQGDIVDTGPITQEQWDSEMETFKLRDADFPDAQDDLILEQQDPAPDPIEPAPYQEETVRNQEKSMPIAGFLFILCFVMVCGIAVIAVLVTIVYLVRRKPA